MNSPLSKSLSDSNTEIQASGKRRQSIIGCTGINGILRRSTFEERKRKTLMDGTNDLTENVSFVENMGNGFAMGRRQSSIEDWRNSFAMKRNNSINSISTISTPNGSLQQLNQKDSLLWGNEKGEDTTGVTRHRRKLANFLHTHVVLIVICVLSILDAACVVVQVIGDILIVKVELHELEMQSKEEAKLLTELIPSWFNSTMHGEMTFGKTLIILRSIKTSIFQEFGREVLNVNEIESSRHRVRRDVQFFGGEYGDNDEGHELLHDIAHYFHFGSVAILSVLMIETLLKVFAMGKSIFNHKIEVFDAFVVSTSWCLDLAFLKGIWMNGTEGATILVFLLPWRVIRVVNSFVVVIQEKGQVAMKIAKSQYKYTLRRLEESRKKYEMAKIEIAQLKSLCKKRGATEDNIKSCKPKMRRKSSIFRRFSSSTVQTETSMDITASLGNEATPRRLSLRRNSSDVGNLENRHIPVIPTEIRRTNSCAAIR